MAARANRAIADACVVGDRVWELDGKAKHEHIAVDGS